VRRGGRLPGDQAEAVFSDILVEQLEQLWAADRLAVLAEIVMLCTAPSSKHPLRTPLAGWNTLDVLGGKRRVVYKAGDVSGVGVIEALCLGPRRDSEVYDLAAGLTLSGKLADDEVTQLWAALALLDVVAESVGLDGWDFRPTPAPDGMQRAAVASGILSAGVAALLSSDEIQAAMTNGWDESGQPDPDRALFAALHRARGRVSPPLDVIEHRGLDRCGARMPRAHTLCIRRRDHPGPHRSG
jgi:hypothetical protein